MSKKTKQTAIGIANFARVGIHSLMEMGRDKPTKNKAVRSVGLKQDVHIQGLADDTSFIVVNGKARFLVKVTEQL